MRLYLKSIPKQNLLKLYHITVLNELSFDLGGFPGEKSTEGLYDCCFLFAVDAFYFWPNLAWLSLRSEIKLIG